MQKITLSLEKTLFAEGIGASYYDDLTENLVKVVGDGVFYHTGSGGRWMKSFHSYTSYFDKDVYEIDFSILDEQSSQEHDYKQLALQMAESVYSLSKTLDSLTIEEGVELQKALEAALIILKETV